ncbi:hypothetical protein LSTR_LSTR002037 [Laodelphax striatellus]|uniref:Claspin n=1 Tax=Laodelphax striatellus TaxID=195883 RepID=A0A482XGR6_LAOST|nr:hypothetical protein LSTR_LSTR002037 [Laodelphax striatellus]
MTSEYNSHSDDDEDIVVSKRKRNIVLEDESEEEATTDVLKQTNKRNSDDEIESDDNDDHAKDNSIAESSKIEALPEDKDDSDNDYVSDNTIVNDRVNNDDSNHSENSSRNSDNDNPKEKKYTFDPSIYDAEESDEENRSKTPEPFVEDERPYDEIQSNHPKSKKSMAKDKSSKQQNKSKKEKPGENMREIRRESQRMLRESKIILPYHVPKQRTLAEFLNRRKSAPSIPMRTTAEQLISLSKQIEQLEKESQEFFKSDSSDNDDDKDDEDYVPENEKHSQSSQDDKIQPNDNDNKTDKVKVDENFNKEKQTDVSHGETNEDGFNAKTNENVANLLVDVAQRLESEVDNNSLEADSKNYENLQPSTKVTTDDNDTELLELSINKNDESIAQDVLCKKDSAILTSSVNEVCSEANSIKDDESDCEDFTLNLTMPEDGENVEENEEEESFTLDLTMPEDSVNIVEDKANGNEDSSTLNLKMLEEKENILEEREKSNEDSSTLNLKMLEDEENIVEDKEKFNEESLTLNLTLPEDSETIVGDKEGNTDLISKDNKSCKLKKIELLSKIHVDLTKVPTLSKSFGGEINLDSPPKKAGMIDLKERFFKHYAMDRKKKKSKSPVKVSVVRAIVDDKGHVEDIKSEMISAGSNKPDDQWLEEIKEAEFPGAKHSKLKQLLQSKAKAKWKEDYEKRLQEYKLNEEEMVGSDKADYEHEAILDDEDEEEDMTNSEEEEEEEEPEENDIELVDKKRKQSKFVEDEADVSEDEDNDDNNSDNEEEEEEEIGEENEDVLLGYNESDGEDEDGEKKDRRKKKKTKKRETASDEESESENEEALDSEAEKRKRKLMTSDSEESENEVSPKRKLMSSDNEEAFQSMEDLAGLCSGKFPTQPVSFSQLEMADADNLLKGFADSQSVAESQNLDLSLPEQSQSLDRSREGSEEEEGGGTQRTKKSILDSDYEQEEDDEIVLNRSHKKRAKAVEYSDDEDEKPKAEAQTDEEDEEEAGGSENSEELVLDEIGNEDGELEYDSEENEVIRDPKAFFEKEAELSESEWGSEDEDEKDLDKFEEEAGDQEVLDEDEVNRELGKIHMQQMLVDDKRDVRILQELLLEDGELHSDGSGRQRQFRWANADSGFVGGDSNTKDSDEDDSDQEEDEENWRKKRHERELFLNKKNERLKELGIEEEDDEEAEEDGDLLGMGRALVKRMQTTVPKPPTTVTSKVSAAAVAMNCKFMAKNMRGSFLKSSDQYLSRLAHITTKVGSEGNVNGPKNSRNFVFSIVSPKKEEVKEAVPEESSKVKKRKASENAANAKKKIHFADDKGNEKRKSLLEVLG